MFSKLSRIYLKSNVRGLFSGSHLGSYAICNPFGLPATLPVNSVQIQICGDLYQKYAEMGRKRYINAPKEGIVARAEYIDNELIVGNKAPATVLLLHGAPGSLNDFTSLTSHLTSLGVRVIAPNLPDYRLWAETKLFLYSPEEKAEFTRGVLESIGVEKVDLLVSHSSGNTTALKLWKDPNAPEIRSFAWLNPMGVSWPASARKALWLYNFLFRALHNKATKAVADKLTSTVLRAMGNSWADMSMDEIFHSYAGFYYAQHSNLRDDLYSLRDKKLPLLFVFGEKDAFISMSLTKEVIDCLGGRLDEATFYDKQHNIIQKGSESWLKLIGLKAGGHFSYKKYSDIVNKAVESHLLEVMNKDGQHRVDPLESESFYKPLMKYRSYQ